MDCGGPAAAVREDRVGHFNIFHNLSFTRRRAVIKPHEHGAWLPRSREERGRAARFTILCGSVLLLILIHFRLLQLHKRTGRLRGEREIGRMCVEGTIMYSVLPSSGKSVPEIQTNSHSHSSSSPSTFGTALHTILVSYLPAAIDRHSTTLSFWYDKVTTFR